VIDYSRSVESDPKATLQQVYGTLVDLVNDEILVSPGSEMAMPISTEVPVGKMLDDFTVVAPVRLIADTEVHLARAPNGSLVSLKLARSGSEQFMAEVLRREAEILTHLNGRGAPRLLAQGTSEGRTFLAMEWCAGSDAYRGSSEARHLGGRQGRAVLLRIAESIARAYAQLHELGVLHGDVHPRNVLIGVHERATIIDFGLGIRLPLSVGHASVARGGIDFFMEPEAAACRIAGSALPALSALGEQYSVAALLYLVLTGAHTHDFSLEPEQMLDQVVHEPPLPFEDHGVDDLHQVSEVIKRSLAHDPDDRFASMAEVAEALHDAAGADLEHASRLPTDRGSGLSQAGLDQLLANLAAPAGESFRGGTPPTASIQYGSAGVAYALARIAGIRQDEVLLGQADLWLLKALSDISNPQAFWSEDLQISIDTVGSTSILHSQTGVYFVATLIAGMRGDEVSLRRMLTLFIETVRTPSEHVDLAFGKAGQLLACAQLVERLPQPVDSHLLMNLGIDLSQDLLERVVARPDIATSSDWRVIGVAHGWAGIFLSILRWCEATNAALPSVLVDRLDQLAKLGQPSGRGLVWPHSIDSPASANPIPAGWCNGAAGFVPLWVLASQLIGNPGYDDCALAAAWTAYESGSDTPDLCCGLVGRAYAALSVYRYTDDEVWLARARRLAVRAGSSARQADLLIGSLFKGEIGLALLTADCEDPRHACFPLLEREPTY
jgi:serine/threonine-protein kinase